MELTPLFLFLFFLRAVKVLFPPLSEETSLARCLNLPSLLSFLARQGRAAGYHARLC